MSPGTISAQQQTLRLAAAPRPQAGRESDFASLLGKATSPDTSRTPEQSARQAAEQFVALTFVQPLLKQLRESNSAAAPFAPGEGEKQFQGLIDADIAQRMVSRSNFPLVDRLTSDLLKARARLTGEPQTETTA